MALQNLSPNTIEMRGVRILREIRLSPPGYVIGPAAETNKAWRWAVARLLKFGVLKRREDKVKSKRIVYTDLQNRDLGDAVLEAINSVRGLQAGPDNGVRVIVGTDIFRQLNSDSDKPVAYMLGPVNGGDGSIFGVPVQYVPWLTGWAVIPDKIDLLVQAGERTHAHAIN